MKITILTRPAGAGWSSGLRENIKSIVKSFYGLAVRRVWSWPRHLGHAAVTRSAVVGLKRLGAEFNYNPDTPEKVNEVVVVLHDLQALEQAVQLKRCGQVKKILAWSLIGKEQFEKEVDVFLVPSQWVKDNDDSFTPNLKDRTKVWFSGVDENFWQPVDRVRDTNNALIYQKNADPGLNLKVEQLVRNYGFYPLTIKYGRYGAGHFKTLLAQSRFAVFLSRSESQGLAMAESWSMDVPTFCWDPQKPIDYIGRKFEAVSSCPYLSEQTGRNWQTLPELELLLQQTKNEQLAFTPRTWVQEHMTDIHSARQLLNYCFYGSN